MRAKYLNGKRITWACIVFILESCTSLEPIDINKSDSYFLKGDKVVFCERANRQVYGVRKCDANRNYLEILSRYIVRDNRYVFYKGKKQKGIDNKSFYIDKGIPKDKNWAYAMTQTKLEVIPNVDASSFDYIKDYYSGIKWAKDKNSFYRNYKKLHVDYGSFELLNKKFSRDKDSIYGWINDSSFGFKSNSSSFKGHSINSYDLEVLNEEYIIVRDSLFYISFLERNLLRKIPLKSKNSIRVINEHIICIDDLVIVKGEEFKYAKVDSETFGLLRPNYLMKYTYDKNLVYFEENVIVKANPKTFKVLDNSFFSKDDKYVFYKKEIIEGDSKSFKKQDNFWIDNQGNKYNQKGIKQ